MFYSLILFILLSPAQAGESKNSVVEITTNQQQQILKVGKRFIYQNTSVKPPKECFIIFSTSEVEDFINKRGDKNTVITVNGSFIKIKEKEYFVILKAKFK